MPGNDADGYAVPRSPLGDAANDVGRNLSPHDTNWIAHLIVGYMHRRAAEAPNATAREFTLDLITVLNEIHKACEHYLSNAVAGARREGATWAQIGERVDVSKQTAYSRWGSIIEHRDGQSFVVDVIRDAEIPLRRIDPDTQPTRAQANPIPPTPDQLRTIADHFAGTEAADPANLDLVANAVVTLARGLADGAGGDWDNPTDANHYLQLALTIAHPKAHPSAQ
ncbi:hypothetical protein K883_05307 [Mycobacterium sp. TKK-01-0059]|nr:hypothetical protein K883_05307 [Mycobacterium sp. TKK-01-0059]